VATLLPDQDVQDLIRFAQTLIRTPSLPTQEGEVAELLAAEMGKVGLEEVHTDRIGNVIGRLGTGKRPILVYNGHMDIVDVGNWADWPFPPYDAHIQDGVLFGRGAADMKGALAAMLYGAKALRDQGTRLRGTLYVVGVVQEEPCEGLAMRVLVEEEGLRPDMVVLGEATNLHISRGQRGRVEMLVEVTGRSSHASSPELGRNAVYDAARLIFGVELLGSRLGHDPFLGSGSITVTEIWSQAASRNAVPDRCTFCIDRRLTLGETETKALVEIRSIIATEGARAKVAVDEYAATSYTGYTCRARKHYPAWMTPEDHPLLQALVRTIRDTLGARPRIGRWSFSTDGVYTMGEAGIPTVGFGPGEEKLVHTPQEQVRLNDIINAARVYAQLPLEVLR
jgi:putative selenium metabolism hydrolase